MLKNKMLTLFILLMLAILATACGSGKGIDPTPLPYTPAPRPTLAPTPTEVIPGDSVAGQVVFEQNCTTCHSLDVGVNIEGPSLSSAGARFTLDYVRESIVEPCPKVVISSETDKKCVSSMPADFKEKLSSTEFDDVVAYVLSLK